MSGGETDPLVELRGELSELRAALEELRSASSPAERREAREEVADAEQDVTAAAKRAGLRPDVYRHALAEARKAQFLDDHADVIRGLVNEELDRLVEAAAEEADEEEPEKKDRGGDAAADGAGGTDRRRPPRPDPSTGGDQGPVHEHWSERRVGEMIG